MAQYKIDFVASAAKEFRDLPPEMKRRVGKEIDFLSQTPRPQGMRKLQGHFSHYRIRVGDYRVIYEYRR